MNKYNLVDKQTSPKLSRFVDGPSKGDQIGICQMYFDDGAQASIARDRNGKVCAILTQNFDIHRRPKKENTGEAIL